MYECIGNRIIKPIRILKDTVEEKISFYPSIFVECSKNQMNIRQINRRKTNFISLPETPKILGSQRVR